jgi:uncharacterized protein DUF6594
MVHSKARQRISLCFSIGKVTKQADNIDVDEIQLRKPVQTEGGDVYDYEDSKFVKMMTSVVTLLATIAASLLPSLIILWLFHVKRTIVRIWITVGCTIGIGVILRLLTNASMKEIFGGTAAYAPAFLSGTV